MLQLSGFVFQIPCLKGKRFATESNTVYCTKTARFSFAHLDDIVPIPLRLIPPKPQQDTGQPSVHAKREKERAK